MPAPSHWNKPWQTLQSLYVSGNQFTKFPSQTHLLDCSYIYFFYFTVQNLSFFVSFFFTTWYNDLNYTKGFFYELKIVFCSGSQVVDAVQKQRGECALNKCTGAGLTLIKHGTRRSTTGEKKPHTVDLTFIQISCGIPAQIMETNHLLTASARCSELKLELPQISLLPKLWFDKTRIGWPSTLCSADYSYASCSLRMHECKFKRKVKLL